MLAKVWSRTYSTALVISASGARTGTKGASRDPRPSDKEHNLVKTLLSIPEAARALGLSRSCFYDVLATGDLPTVRLLGRRLVDPDDLAALIEKSKKS